MWVIWAGKGKPFNWMRKRFPDKLCKIAEIDSGRYKRVYRKLDEMGYTVFRQYTGLENYYVSNANTLAPDNSDFPYVENVRVLNRIVREVTKGQLKTFSRRLIRKRLRPV